MQDFPATEESWGQTNEPAQPGAMSGMGAALERLDKVTSQLVDRLKPVSRSAVPQEVTSEKPG